jgi:hypothetical protein
MILFVLLFTLASISRAEVAALHEGLTDPVTEGWTRYRPFLDVATFPVANDFGMGIGAWSIDDNAGFGPPGHDGVYGVVLTSNEIMRAEQSGWRYSVNMRIVDSELGVTHDSITSFVITSDSAYSMR